MDDAINASWWAVFGLCAWIYWSVFVWVEYIEPLGWHPAITAITVITGGGIATVLTLLSAFLALAAAGAILVAVVAVYLLTPVISLGVIADELGERMGNPPGTIALVLAPFAFLGWFVAVSIGGWWSAVPIIATGGLAYLFHTERPPRSRGQV
ncbi:hypothetical protein K0U83_17920 [bacterium]|nr:hypothetical protein [bacterium]